MKIFVQDSKLVTSVSATERMKLWDKFSGPVDQDAIKTEFFRKVHCKNPPFRIKVKLGTRKKVKVPAMVIHHYKNPIPLLPSLRDVLRLETVLNRSSEEYDIMNSNYVQDNYESDRINGQISNINGQISENKVDNSNEELMNGITKLKNEIKNEDITNGQCNGNLQKDMVKLPDIVSGIHADSKYNCSHFSRELLRSLIYMYSNLHVCILQYSI